jgi:predicted nucleic acid-binding protein
MLDTTAFSDILRGDPRVEAKLEAIASDDRLAICSIVRGEIRYGLERLAVGKRRAALEAKA